MRIRVGTVCLDVEGDRELQGALRSLFRHLSNKELGDILGISERTVRRWKDEGQLPSKGRERLTMLDLLQTIQGGEITEPAGRPSGPEDSARPGIV
ncbi:MAG: helix-turn-helix domain-containing protein [Deltaproteobacteria bacterium]|nr:helix-turn-helix domain-containing protein [Deltaproteobacteria bacterium]